MNNESKKKKIKTLFLDNAKVTDFEFSQILELFYIGIIKIIQFSLSKMMTLLDYMYASAIENSLQSI